MTRAPAKHPAMDTLLDHGYEAVYSRHGLLYIEPSAATSAKPCLDRLTRKMTAALRANTGPILAFLGCHECACGVWSSSEDYMIAGGRVTNSLAVHYLAFHRAEVPESELEKVAKLDVAGETPTEKELQTPPNTAKQS